MWVERTLVYVDALSVYAELAIPTKKHSLPNYKLAFINMYYISHTMHRFMLSKIISKASSNNMKSNAKKASF